MRIVFKLPTRGRAAQADDLLTRLRATESGLHEVSYCVVTDHDDTAWDAFFGRLMSWGVIVGQVFNPPTTYIADRHSGKFDAANAHTPPLDTFDIIIAGSDDLWPEVEGWDDTISQDMQRLYPALDGVLWYHDGHNDKVPCYPIYGREALRRFGGDLWPRCYRSFYGDDEVRDRASAMGILGDLRDTTLFRHRHPDWGTAEQDDLYRRNAAGVMRDRMVYLERVANGFPVDAEGRAI